MPGTPQVPEAPTVQRFVAREEDLSEARRRSSSTTPGVGTGTLPCCLLRTCLHAPKFGFVNSVVSNMIDFKFYRAGMYQGGRFQRSEEPLFPAADYTSSHGFKVVDTSLAPTFKPSGAELSIRIAAPGHSPTSKAPIVLFMHGGGFVFGSARGKSYFECIKALSMAWGGQVYVIAPEYRLAPEFPFPHAVHDCYDVLRWLASDASHALLPSDLADRRNIILAGDSAGGNLAVVLACLLNDRIQPDHEPAGEDLERLEVAGVGLVYPVMLVPEPVQSMVEFVESPILKPWHMLWFDQAYLGDGGRGNVGSDFRACPLYANFSGLPPVILASAECDPIRDESYLLAQKLRDAEVLVRHHHSKGSGHGFLNMPWDVNGKRTWQAVLDDLVKLTRPAREDEVVGLAPALDDGQ